MRTRILVVDDSEADRQHLVAIAGRITEHAEVVGVQRGEYAITEAEYRRYDLAIVDQVLPGSVDGLKLVDWFRKRMLNVPVVMVSGTVDVRGTARAMKAGAWDVLTKPVGESELIDTCRDALASRRLGRQVAEAVSGVVRTPAMGELVGSSRAMEEVREAIRLYGPRGTAPVLIVGETGTGKELVARALHAASPRSARPLVPVNCAEGEPHLLRSELFGYVKGAFTGANKDRLGVVAQSAGGTILLDEFNSLAGEDQGMLLRLLEQGEYVRVGDRATILKADARFIFATNKDPEELMSSGRMREDLYSRICRCRIDIAPLRRRMEDVREMIPHFVKRVAAEAGLRVDRIEENVYAAAEKYTWRRNAREVLNVVACSLDYLGGSRSLTAEMLAKAAKKVGVEESAKMVGRLLKGESLPMVEDRLDAEKDARILELASQTGDMELIGREVGLSSRQVRRRLERLRREQGSGAAEHDGGRSPGG